MTFTDELTTPDSPASRFLRDHLPERSRIVDAWANQVAQGPAAVTTLDWEKRAGVGAAFEWRLAFDLADDVPYTDILDLIPDPDVARLLTAAGFRASQSDSDAPIASWIKAPDSAPSQPNAELDGDLWFACHFAKHLRKTREADREQWRGLYRLLRHELLNDDPGADVIEAMASLWRTYTRDGRTNLLALGRPHIIRPVFDNAFAAGDLILGSTLIDVKVYVDPRDSLHQFLDQLLGYVLFDTADRFAIQAIGVYLGWQGMLLTLPLEEALRIGSGPQRFDLPAARRTFRSEIQPALERSWFYKYGKPGPPPP